MQSKKEFKRIVVKIGSSLIGFENGRIDMRNLENIVRQINTLSDSGVEVIIVSSGAIACGMSLLKLKKRPKDIASLQAAAAIGQNELMGAYSKLLAAKRKLCAQLLLTWEDFEDRGRFLNVKHTLSTLLKNKVLAVINENDTVSTNEIRFGDNDKLSALVANLINAELLVILSDIDGLYCNAQKDVLAVVERITPEVTRLCRGTNKEACVGGMSAKLDAIKLATEAGIFCIVANGTHGDALLRSTSASHAGTLFLTKGTNLQAKKRWIAYGVRTKGIVVVDSGAKDALVNKNKSLLSVGIINIRGDFSKNDIVSIADKENGEFARGKVNFSKADLESQTGMRMKCEVIHKDNLVIL